MSVTSIRCGHVNVHHSGTSVATLVQRLVDEKGIFIYSIVEPYLGKKSTPVGFPKSTPVHYGAEHPRAALWTSLRQGFFPLADLSDRDVVAGIVETKQGKTCFVSAYFDVLDGEVIPEKLVKVVDYCAQRSIRLIMNADLNAHSPLWGCEDANP